MRSKRSFQSLLCRTNEAATKAGDLMRECGDAFVERYGVSFSDVDADQLVEPLDYGGGQAPTVEECDAIMASYGYPKLAAGVTGSRAQ